MNRAETEETELHEKAVAQWENEGGTTRLSPKADRKAAIRLVSSSFPPNVPLMPSGW